MDVQKSNVELILSDVKALTTQVARLPSKKDLELLKNTTLDSVQSLRPDNTAINSLRTELTTTNRNLVDSVNNVTHDIQILGKTFANSSETIGKEIESLSRFERVIMQTADNVLDAKRRAEYGVHQIISEMAQLMKSSSKDIQSAIDERFDTFEMSVLDEETGALANLTSKIGSEIDQVWRQIGIMHQQMSASTDTLNKLQNQTDAYVNGSLNVMDNVKGKVSIKLSSVNDTISLTSEH